jgi:hypothetical protein
MGDRLFQFSQGLVDPPKPPGDPPPEPMGDPEHEPVGDPDSDPEPEDDPDETPEPIGDPDEPEAGHRSTPAGRRWRRSPGR